MKIEIETTMAETKQTAPAQQVTLYVCSGCERCDGAAIFLRGWANGRPNVALEIVSIGDQPWQVVRLGIAHTPALVIDDELLAQNISVNKLAELLRTSLNGPESNPQSVS